MTFDAALASSSEVLIWVDGACHPNPDGYGGWACVFRVSEHRFELSGSAHPTTNNRMEMTAAVRALEAVISALADATVEQAFRPRRIVVTSDSSYVVDGITKWLAGWLRTGRISTAPNRDLWMELKAAADALGDVEWVHVRGHQGDEDNEACDRLAVAARKALRAEREGGKA